MGKQLKKIAKYSMTAVLATSALVPSAVAFAADEKPVAKDVTHIVVENESGLVKLNLEDYGTALALGIMKDTDVKYVVADNGEIFSLEDYGTALALSDNAKEKALEVLAKDSLQQDVKVKEGTISEDGKAVTDETPEEKVNETFFYNLAA